MSLRFVTAKSGGGIKSEINITPLVDVVLVLLIIFMVIGPMIQPGIDVRLPETPKPDTLETSEGKSVIFTLKFGAGPDDGRLFYGKDEVPSDRLGDTLEALRQGGAEKAILIKSDQRLNFGPVKQVMRACNQRGFESVSLVAAKEGS